MKIAVNAFPEYADVIAHDAVDEKIAGRFVRQSQSVEKALTAICDRAAGVV